MHLQTASIKRFPDARDCVHTVRLLMRVTTATFYYMICYLISSWLFRWICVVWTGTALDNLSRRRHTLCRVCFVFMSEKKVFSRLGNSHWYELCVNVLDPVTVFPLRFERCSCVTLAALNTFFFMNKNSLLYCTRVKLIVIRISGVDCQEKPCLTSGIFFINITWIHLYCELFSFYFWIKSYLDIYFVGFKGKV